MRILFITLILATCTTQGSGQVLISLLLGDKLNTGKIEFGLDGGLAISSISGLSPSAARPSFNLGFYFDIRLKNPSWMLHTGVLVKSAMGAEDNAVYPLNDVDLDNAFSEGSVNKKLSYFNIPVLLKYRWQNNFYIEAGPMLGLMNKATDEFVATVNKKNDLTLKVNIRDQYHPLDAGLIAGIGYRLMRGNGMNLGIRYYYGFVDITIEDTAHGQFNRAMYFSVGIPIGVGKAAADSGQQDN